MDTAYDEFTESEDRPRFLRRVEPIDQLPRDRLAWRSTEAHRTAGLASFHALSDRLTCIHVTLDPGMRSSRRALRSELRRFKASVELGSVS